MDPSDDARKILFTKNGAPLQFYLPKPSQSNLATHDLVIDRICAGGGCIASKISTEVLVIMIMSTGLPLPQIAVVPKGYLSHKFVLDSWEKGVQMPTELYTLGAAKASPKRTNTANRCNFTEEEDQEIFVYVRDRRSHTPNTALTQPLFEELLEDCPHIAQRHTWQSVRDRYRIRLAHRRNWLTVPPTWTANRRKISGDRPRTVDTPPSKSQSDTQPALKSNAPTQTQITPLARETQPKKSSAPPPCEDSQRPSKRRRVLLGESANRFVGFCESTNKVICGSQTESQDSHDFDGAIQLNHTDPSANSDEQNNMQTTKQKKIQHQDHISRSLCLQLARGESDDWPDAVEDFVDTHGREVVGAVLCMTSGDAAIAVELLEGNDVAPELVWKQPEDDLILQLCRRYPDQEELKKVVGLLGQEDALVGPESEDDALTPGMMLVLEKHRVSQTLDRVQFLKS